MKEIFDDYVENSFGEGKQAEFKFLQFRHNYRPFFPESTELRVLDIGIGRGEMLTCMKDWGYNALGIDISPSTVRFCQSLGLPCEVVEDTPEYLRSQSGEFQLITLLDVIEHIPREHVVDFASAVRDALAPNGRVIFQMPNLQAPHGHLHMFNDVTHYVGYVEHSFAQVLIAAGYRNFRFYPYEELIRATPLNLIKRFLRKIYFFKTRVERSVSANLNPKILTPVFFCVAEK